MWLLFCLIGFASTSCTAVQGGVEYGKQANHKRSITLLFLTGDTPTKVGLCTERGTVFTVIPMGICKSSSDAMTKKELL